jgi:hypothetical protein
MNTVAFCRTKNEGRKPEDSGLCAKTSTKNTVQ